jgi:hypothetical protein
MISQTDDELRQRIWQAIEGRKHWVFLVAPTHAQNVATIAQQFYLPGSGADEFAALLLYDVPGLWPVCGVVLAAKARLSPDQLGEELVRQGDRFQLSAATAAENLVKRDIVYIGHPEGSSQRWMAFHDWIMAWRRSQR